MKRTLISIQELSSWSNLNLALYRAAKGKRQRQDVKDFLLNKDELLADIQQQIRQLRIPDDPYRVFYIKDPKPRKIVAVSFATRVIHHAIMNLAGRRFEHSQIEHSYACLPNRGVHKAVFHVQKSLRTSGWYGQIDIQKYFEHIDHQLLNEALSKRFKGKEFLLLLQHIIHSYEDSAGKGLPIGSLTSQYFANFYLETLDRRLSALPQVVKYVRYMDDIAWFCRSKADVESVLQVANEVADQLQLQIKDKVKIQPTHQGMGYCGFRILQDRVLMSRRKKKSFKSHAAQCIEQWQAGELSDLELQSAMDGVMNIPYPAVSFNYRKKVFDLLADVDV